VQVDQVPGSQVPGVQAIRLPSTFDRVTERLSARYAYLGPAGTFTEAALRSVPELAHADRPWRLRICRYSCGAET